MNKAGLASELKFEKEDKKSYSQNTESDYKIKFRENRKNQIL